MTQGLYLILMFTVLLGVAACNSVDLSAVSDFATKTTQAKASFDDLSEDWLGTCIRRTEYSRVTQSQLRMVPDDTIDPGSSSEGCGVAAIFASQWMTRNDLVVAYVRSLGALADVGSVPNNTEELAAGLSGIGMLPVNDRSAFSDLAGKIAAAAVGGQQRRAIGDFAKANDDALKIAIGDLDFLADRYDELLISESSSLDELYRDTLRAQTVGGTDSLPEPTSFQARRLDFEAVREDWEMRRSTLRHRHAKVAAYRDALSMILKSHALIVSRASRFDRSDLENVLKGYASAFGDDVATLSNAQEK